MINPLNETTKDVNEYFLDMKKMYAKAYNKNKTSPYTKTRVILLNGLEFESNWFMHQFARNCNNEELRQEIAVIRKQEQQQQKRIASLKPINESILETTIAYEQLAIDLTATLAQNETDKNNIEALNFALLEDFDHLYRFANLLYLDKGIDATTLVGKFTEIMPGRPTISEHRYPKDDIKKPMNAQKAKLYSKLVGNIITAAEQQTMNYYMNIAQWYKNDLGRKLYSEIAMIEEQHVSQYESLKDPNCTWLQQWVMHEYTECYLYFSAYSEETDEYIKGIWKEHYYMEVAHLKKAIELLEKFEKTSYTTVFGDGTFPTLLKHGSNIKYIREVLNRTINLTGNRTSYIDVNKLKDDADYFCYQKACIKKDEDVASHNVIIKAINKLGKDVRFQTSAHPIKELQNRTKDNTKIARFKD